MNYQITLTENVNEAKGKRLYREFRIAWNETPTRDKISWCSRSASTFARITVRRGKGLLNFAKDVLCKVGEEATDLGKAIKHKRLEQHIINRKDKSLNIISDKYHSSRDVIKNCYKLLKDNPREFGPILFLGIIGFFCGAGTDIGEKTWYDIDGGIPDLDFLGGVGNHRNMFFHSVISAAVLETMIYSVVDASKTIYKHLPEDHDVFWDNLNSYENWANAFVTGACTGIMYHLLIDGTLDGNKAMTNFPISMSMDGHNAFFISNAVAEGIDLKNKRSVLNGRK